MKIQYQIIPNRKLSMLNASRIFILLVMLLVLSFQEICFAQNSASKISVGDQFTGKPVYFPSGAFQCRGSFDIIGEISGKQVATVIVAENLPDRIFPEKGMSIPDGAIRIKPTGKQLWEPAIVASIEGKSKVNINTGYVPNPILAAIANETKQHKFSKALLEKNRELVEKILRENYSVDCKVTQNVNLSFTFDDAYGFQLRVTSTDQPLMDNSMIVYFSFSHPCGRIPSKD